jgi:hypothetical protein
LNQPRLSTWPEHDPIDCGTNTIANLPDAICYGQGSPDQSDQDIYRGSPGQIEGPHDPAGQSPLREPFTFDDAATQADSECPVSPDTDVIFSFYPFLELNIQSHMFPQDVNFLEQQACFRVPTRPALDELIRQYFLHVHPSLPMIDEGAFWEMYTYRGVIPAERPRISLFVFQAMAFAASGVSGAFHGPGIF